MTEREKVTIEIEDALSGNLAKAGHVYRMSLNGLKDKALKDALALLKEQEAKTGHWIDTTKVIGFPRVECSVCGSGQGAIWMDYCPICGTKMESW